MCVRVHVRIDPGIIRVQKVDPPHPPTGVRPGVILGGKKFKSPGNVMNCRENRYNPPPHIHPYPTGGVGGGLGGQNVKVKVTKHNVL